MREFEAQEMGGLVDVVAVHQMILALLDYEVVDVTDGRAIYLSYESFIRK